MADFDYRGARAEGYSDAEILDYAAKAGKLGKFDLQGAIKEGYTPSEIIDHLSAPTAGSVAKQVGTGLVQGTAGLIGLPRLAQDAVGSLLDKVLPAPSNPDALKRAREEAPTLFPKASSVTGAVEKVTGQLPQPQNTVEDYANFGGSMLPNMAGGEGSILRRLMTGVVGPTAVGETAGQVADKVAPEAAPIVRGVGAVIGGIPGSRAPVAAPERAALERTSDAQLASTGPQGAYGFNNVALDAGVMPRLVQNIRQDAFNSRLGNPALAPEAHAELERMANAVQAPGATTLTDLHQARQLLASAGAEGGQNSAVAAIAHRHIDDYLRNIPAGDVLSNTGGVTPAMYGANRVVAGPNPADVARAQQGGRTLLDAIANKHAQMNSERLAGEFGQLDKASVKAHTANSGLNVGQYIRGTTAKDLMASEGFGLAANEQQALRRLADGTRAMNFARRAANMLGGGGGLGMTHVAGIGAAIGGGAGASEGGVPGAMSGSAIGAALLPFLGVLARRTHNNMVLKEAHRIDAMMRARSPLGGNRIVPAVPQSMAARRALTALMAYQAAAQRNGNRR
jgi:hypothetical protein